MHVATTRRQHNGVVYETHPLRRSFREGGKVKNVTLAPTSRTCRPRRSSSSVSRSGTRPMCWPARASTSSAASRTATSPPLRVGGQARHGKAARTCMRRAGPGPLPRHRPDRSLGAGSPGNMVEAIAGEDVGVPTERKPSPAKSCRAKAAPSHVAFAHRSANSFIHRHTTRRGTPPVSPPPSARRLWKLTTATKASRAGRRASPERDACRVDGRECGGSTAMPRPGTVTPSSRRTTHGV